ncbi:MAG: hypothetical protein IPP74_07065 [Alphaproteobacteria bacterium]|nr:hypothetical protein [Alphaproteobacteria bacterium]
MGIMRENVLRKLHHVLVMTLSVILVIQPVIGSLAYAQTIITPDITAPIANQPTVSESLNHTPVENIVTPNAGGVSHNKLGELQVGSEGLIVNNSASSGVSTIGSIVVGNGHLSTGNEARMIINEVTGTNAPRCKDRQRYWVRKRSMLSLILMGLAVTGVDSSIHHE